jgi:hypothetical protein
VAHDDVWYTMLSTMVSIQSYRDVLEATSEPLKDSPESARGPGSGAMYRQPYDDAASAFDIYPR